MWLEKGKITRFIRISVAGILEFVSKPCCEYCNVNWGLRTESIENVEQLFDKFAAKNNIDKK